MTLLRRYSSRLIVILIITTLFIIIRLLISIRIMIVSRPSIKTTIVSIRNSISILSRSEYHLLKPIIIIRVIIRAIIRVIIRVIIRASLRINQEILVITSVILMMISLKSLKHVMLVIK